MSLLSVTVKKAHYVGAQAAAQVNSYVTLKLQNVKSTTVTVKGASPCWEQDFLFETNDLNTGLLIEVWGKGMIWDRAMGYHWLPLQGIPYTTTQEEAAKWLSLDAELVMRDGEVVGTKNPTGNSLLVECRFELPFDPENIEASDLQKKLEMLNNIMDPEARAEQARRQMQYFGHSGYSEDSDYTSDLNYPVGQHANSSASQFRSAAHQMHTPQRSLETSRENSYERDDGVVHHYLPQPPSTHQQHLSPSLHRPRHMQQRYSPNMDDYGYGSPNVSNNRLGGAYPENNIDAEPLFYNSRPRSKEYTSQEWNSSQDTYYGTQPHFDNVDTCNDYTGDMNGDQRAKDGRRPSLERQTSLYDDYTDINTYTTNQLNEMSYVNTSGRPQINHENTDDYYNTTTSYPFHDERYGQDDEDRQWDSGGVFIPPKTSSSSSGKKLPSIPSKRYAPVIAQDENYDTTNISGAPTPTPGRRKCLPQIPMKQSFSRQSSINDEYDGYRTPTETSHRGASLPPTPTKTPKLMTRIMAGGKPFNSLPPTPGRQLPKPNLSNRSSVRRAALLKRTSSAEYADTDDIYSTYDMRPGALSARDNYNEDYNYAYQSTDHLPDAQSEDMNMGVSSVLTSTPITTWSRTVVTASSDYQYNNNNIGLEQTFQYNAQDSVDLYVSETDSSSLKPDLGIYTTSYQRQLPVTSSVQQNHNLNTTQTSVPLAPSVPNVADMTKAATSLIGMQAGKLKLFGSRLKSSLLMQPTTESLEPHDDDLKNSFDTAISSISNSIANQYPEYSTSGFDTGTETIVSSYVPTVPLATTSVAQYPRDQPEQAILTANGIQTRLNWQNRSHFTQQESIDGGWPPETVYDHTTTTTFYEEDENYILEEDEEQTTPVNGDYPKAIAMTQESPASVIHVDLIERRLSSQAPISDPYQEEDVVEVSKVNGFTSRRPSVDPYANVAIVPPVNNAPSEYLVDDPYQIRTIPAVQRQSIIPELDDVEQPSSELIEHASPTIEEEQRELDEEKRVSFEEDLIDEQKPTQRAQVTAQQRWHWAYNKIIMQLNVSVCISPSTKTPS